MKNSKKINCIAMPLLCLVLLTTQRCSVIGYTVGKIDDLKTPAKTVIPMDQLENLKQGLNIKVRLMNGDSVTGKYVGMDTIPDDQYAAYYSEAFSGKPGNTILPALGDSITIQYFMETDPDSVLKVDGKFCGFGVNRLLMVAKGFFRKTNVPFSIILSVANRNGYTFSGVELKRLMSENQIPVQESFKVQNQGKVTSVALNDIGEIDILNSRDMATSGFFTGLLVDVVILILISSINIEPDFSGITF